MKDKKQEKSCEGLRGMVLLRGVVAGLLAALVAFAAFDVFLLTPQGAADPARLYDYVYSGIKSQSINFTLANMSSDSYLAFGSSEFYISKNLVPQCPQAVFGETVSGVDLCYVGEAYDQSLWQAIAAAAYGNKAKNKKVMLVVSPQWFFKNSGSQDKFSSKFSYELYRAFVNNPSLSANTKAYVRTRIENLGVSGDKVAAANRDNPLEALNDLANSFAEDLHLRSKLSGVISQSPLKSKERRAGISTGEPNWDALLDEAEQSGEQACTTNEYGIYDAYWERNSQYNAEQDQNFHQADAEYDDLSCFLDVCNEVGLDPLVVVLPVHGLWYDHEGVSNQERQTYYDRIRQLCKEHDNSYADFSSCEYEKYFLCDTVHPGWRGWVRIEKVFYDFVHDKDDEFLGGRLFGEATGLLRTDTSQGETP